MSTKLDGGTYRGLLFKINKFESIEIYVDVSFAGEWNKSWSTESSRIGFVVYYSGCPCIWISKLQTEISLSTTEAEYTTISYSMREVISMMTLLGESKEVLPIGNEVTKIHYTIFEDNKSCIELVKCPKMKPRTKHVGLKYNHLGQRFMKS